MELDRAAARTAISAAAGRFVGLLRETDDIERHAGGNWTVAETAAHVAIVFTAFCAAVAAEPVPLPHDDDPDHDFPTRLAAVNAATIAMVDHTDAQHLAELITTGAQRFLRLVADADGAIQCDTPWYGPGRKRTVNCLTALALGELAVHGHDITTGTGASWPIPAAHAKLIVGTVCPHMSPLIVRPDAARGTSVTYEIRLRDDGPNYVIEVADGAAEVRPAGGPVDCILTADPAAFLLVAYGRTPMESALRRGDIVATGPRPWLGQHYDELFFEP